MCSRKSGREFTEFPEAVNENTDGISKHRLSPYNAHYLNYNSVSGYITLWIWDLKLFKVVQFYKTRSTMGNVLTAKKTEVVFWLYYSETKQPYFQAMPMYLLVSCQAAWNRSRTSCGWRRGSLVAGCHSRTHSGMLHSTGLYKVRHKYAT